jgi:hypothetical protein
VGNVDKKVDEKVDENGVKKAVEWELTRWTRREMRRWTRSGSGDHGVHFKTN